MHFSIFEEDSTLAGSGRVAGGVRCINGRAFWCAEIGNQTVCVPYEYSMPNTPVPPCPPAAERLMAPRRFRMCIDGGAWSCFTLNGVAVCDTQLPGWSHLCGDGVYVLTLPERNYTPPSRY